MAAKARPKKRRNCGKYLFGLLPFPHSSSSGNSVSVGRPRTQRLSSMNWFRSRVRSGAQLALFALAVQMVLSFGHMHRDDLGLPPLAGTDPTQIASAAAPAPVPPAGQHHQPASDDYCPICASIAVLATWVPALPPVLVSPEPMRRVWAPLASLQRSPTQISLSFQARAPPVV
jgi:hypothetical protein